MYVRAWEGVGGGGARCGGQGTGGGLGVGGRGRGGGRCWE